MFALFTPALVLAAGASPSETDIFPRTANFIIFAAIMYYLLADKIKEAYKGRISGIAQKLDSIQIKVKESVNAKEAAQAKVQEAKANAKALVETAKKEAVLIGEKVDKETQSELANLEKSFNEKTEIERRKMAREVVFSVLDDTFGKDAIALDKEELVKIVMKKVA